MSWCFFYEGVGYFVFLCAFVICVLCLLMGCTMLLCLTFWDYGFVSLCGYGCLIVY